MVRAEAALPQNQSSETALISSASPSEIQGEEVEEGERERTGGQAEAEEVEEIEKAEKS